MSNGTAIQLTSFGATTFDNVVVAKTPIPTPGPGEVLVRINCRPINPADIFSIMGVYPGFKPAELPAVPGLEGAGTIAQLGPGCSGRLAEGQRVVSVAWRGTRAGSGTWQQYVVTPEEDLVPIPDALPDEAACQALVNPVPVVGMIQGLEAPKGSYIIVTAAGSALGRMALSYARHMGLKTIATCRRAEQEAELRAAGADEVVVLSSDEDGPKLAERALALTGGVGAWGALECIAGNTTVQVAAAVRPTGTVWLYGAMNGLDVKWDVVQGLFRMIQLKGFWLMPWLDAQPIEAQRKIVAEILDLMVAGVLPPAKVDVRPLEEVVAALQEQNTVGRAAKLLLRG